jgi:hypothetical protein
MDTIYYIGVVAIAVLSVAGSLIVLIAKTMERCRLQVH